MATSKQKVAARKNIKKATKAAKRKKTITRPSRVVLREIKVRSGP